MPGQYWKQVHASGLEVPSDRPLDDLTAELTTMLGDTDPEARDGTAYPTLATWVGRGVYDDLLVGLGDGMAAGLGVGLGERDTDSVFRRSFSALVLGECIGRDNARPLVAGGKVWRPGCSASGTCAGSCPARAGRTRWRTVPTRWAPSPGHRTWAPTS
jgi:hypothetical protein